MADAESDLRASSSSDARLARFLDQLVAVLPASAAVALVTGGTDGTDGTDSCWAAAGTMAPGEPRLPDCRSRFDLASLTKPMVATLALRLDTAGMLPMTARIGDLAAGAHPRLVRRPVGSLLRHRSGLVPWTPLMLRCRTPGEAGTVIASGGPGGILLGARPGTYSDLGYMLWGFLAERVLGSSLGDLLARWVTAPLGLETVGPSPGAGPDVVACALDNGIEVRLAAEQGFGLAPERSLRRGLAQDGNARFLAGLAGHAGLFGSARDLLRLAQAWLAPDGRFLDAPAVSRALGGRGTYALGWARRRIRGSAGRSLPAAAFGHTGFTGTSLWLDPPGGRIFALLIHRLESEVPMNPWRRRFHDLATSFWR